jgi:phage protein D
MLNTVPAVSAGRQPRSIVKIMGSDGNPAKAVTGWIRWDCDNNAHYSADTFRVTFAVQGLPKDMDVNWMLAQNFINVEILAGFPADPINFNATELSSLIIGRADEVEFDPVQNTIEITGRDYTSVFLDSKTLIQHWKNSTVYDVVKKMASIHGLAVNLYLPTVTAAPLTKIGAYTDIDWTSLSIEETEWDFLIRMAHLVQYDIWVSGTSLNFQPQIDAAQQDYYLLKWVAPDRINSFVPTANVIDMKLRHDMTIAKGIQVQVSSWHPGMGKAVFSKFPATTKQLNGALNGLGAANPQYYKYTISGLDQKAADQRAVAIYNEIAKQEMKIFATLPGDNILNNRTMVRLIGTGAAFDQLYYPSSVHRTMSIDDGYRMSLEARTYPLLQAANQQYLQTQQLKQALQ